jgi:hypothetical protein
MVVTENGDISAMKLGCRYEFWAHGQSGEVFAVRLNVKGSITGCRGPLLSNEMRTARLPEYRYDEDPRDLAWIEAHRESWAPSEIQSPPQYY